MNNYWKNFENMHLEYSFEAYDEQSGYSEGETFDNLQDALDAFTAWTLEENGAASAKRIGINVCVPTDRGEFDVFASFTALEEHYGEQSEYTITEAAEILGLTRQRVHVLINSGKLEAHKRGNSWFIYRRSIENRLAQ